MKGDIIVYENQKVDDVFLVIDGELSKKSSILKRKSKVKPGEYFGGVLPFIFPLFNFKAK